MASKPDRVTEAQIGLATLQVLAERPNGEATVKTIKKHIPNFVKLSAADRMPSETRKGEQMWEQQVRNLKSHSDTPGNVIYEGYLERPKKGTYRITPAGRRYLKSKGL